MTHDTDIHEAELNEPISPLTDLENDMNYEMKSWKEIQTLRSEATSGARKNAKEITWIGWGDNRTHRYGYIASRGFVFYGLGIDGDGVLYGADCWEVPTTKAEFIVEVERIFKQYPTVVTIGIAVDYDGADSLHAYNVEGDYDPMISSSDVPDLATRKDYRLEETIEIYLTEDEKKAIAVTDLWNAAEKTKREFRDPSKGIHLEVINETLIKVVWNLKDLHTANPINSVQAHVRDTLATIRKHFRGLVADLPRIEAVKDVETFQFTDAAQLKDWLNGFSKLDLRSVSLNIGESQYLTLNHKEVIAGSELKRTDFYLS